MSNSYNDSNYPFDISTRSFTGGGTPNQGGLFGGGGGTAGGAPNQGGFFGGGGGAGGGAPNQGGFFGGGGGAGGGGSMYPGLGGNPYGGSFPQPQAPPLPTAPTGTGGTGGLLGNFNIGQLKNVLDRMGGIDGVITTMSKVQKVVASFQQMAPMLKLMLGSFGGKAAKTKNAGLDTPPPMRRRRRKKRAGSTRPGTGVGAGKRPSGSRPRR